MHMRMLSFLLLALFLTAKAEAADADLIVGVLEDVPGVYVGEATTHRVRVIFKHVGNAWESFPYKCSPPVVCLAQLTSKYPARTHWNISLAGHHLGTVEAGTPQDFAWYSHIGMQDIVSSNAVPSVGEPTAK